MDYDLDIIIPDWPAPPGVHAYSTTRAGGVSTGPYRSLNLADHVGDVGLNILENRNILYRHLSLPSQPRWLKQVHGDRVVRLEETPDKAVDADASISSHSGMVNVVMTADCVPVLLTDETGKQVAAIHAGWKGLVKGVIPATVRHMRSGSTLLAWIGPAIGKDAFEVGADVKDLLLTTNQRWVDYIEVNAVGRWQVDLIGIATDQLNQSGVDNVFGGHWCTYKDEQRFFSYRRDGVTGRMASLIWKE